jgi:Meckel syndrome type 1 protein
MRVRAVNRIVAAAQLITRSREVRPLAKTPRTWTGARTPSGLKRVRQAERRREILQPRRTAAKTFVAKALDVATHQADPETAATALSEAHAALDRAAKAGAIHPNAAARRKSRLTLKFNAATGGAHVQTSTRVTKTTSKSQAVKAAKSRIAASKADKAKGAQTAAGKARAALSKTARADAAAKAAASAAGASAAGPAAKSAPKAAAKPAAKAASKTAAKATKPKAKAATTAKSKAPAKKTAAKS